MLAEWLTLFIIITFICLILSIFVMEEQPYLAMPLIMIGMLFSVVCAYGVYQVDYVYVAYNSTIGNSSAYTYSVSYGEPYSFIFVFLFFVFFMLIFKCAFNTLRDVLKRR